MKHRLHIADTLVFTIGLTFVFIFAPHLKAQNSNVLAWKDNLCKTNLGANEVVLSLEAAIKPSRGCSLQSDNRALSTSYKLFQTAAPPGSLMVTSTGNEFKRISKGTLMGWHDMGIGGKTWYDTITKSSMNQFQAEAHCKSLGLDLPSGYTKNLNGQYNYLNKDSDFTVAVNHEMREVLRNMVGVHLWSNSIHPILFGRAILFDGTTGGYEFEDRYLSPLLFKTYSAVCVGD